MKRPLAAFSTLALTIGLIWIVCGCQLFGRNPGPPSKLENSLFTVTTNYVPVVVAQTNVVPVTTYQTNTVQLQVTNVQGVTELRTNVIVIPVVAYQTNVASVTNLTIERTYAPGPTLTGAEGIASAIPVYGTLASTAIAGLAAIWGWLRSSKNRTTAANTMQVVETMRQFIKALPDGTKYDNALMQWAQAHQADAGVLTNVLTLLENEVSNPDAQFAAQSVIATINGLTGPAPIAQTPVATPKV